MLLILKHVIYVPILFMISDYICTWVYLYAIAVSTDSLIMDICLHSPLVGI